MAIWLISLLIEKFIGGKYLKCNLKIKLEYFISERNFTALHYTHFTI